MSELLENGAGSSDRVEPRALGAFVRFAVEVNRQNMPQARCVSRIDDVDAPNGMNVGYMQAPMGMPGPLSEDMRGKSGANANWDKGGTIRLRGSDDSGPCGGRDNFGSGCLMDVAGGCGGPFADPQDRKGKGGKNRDRGCKGDGKGDRGRKNRGRGPPSGACVSMDDGVYGDSFGAHADLEAIPCPLERVDRARAV